MKILKRFALLLGLTSCVSANLVSIASADSTADLIVPLYVVKYRQTTTQGFKQHLFYHVHDRTKVLFALDVLPDIPYPSLQSLASN